MPAYDYRCEENGRTLELRHGMHQHVSTWGELCELLGIDPGPTRREAPVRKLIGAGGVVKSEHLGSGIEPPCASGPCCGGGRCEM